MKQRLILFLLMFLIKRLFTNSPFIKGLENAVSEAESLSLKGTEKQHIVVGYLQQNGAQLKEQYPERLMNLATEIVVAYVKSN